MSNKNNENNDKSLIAWNAWKEKCAVANCGSDQQTVLCKEIYNAFKKKFSQICPLNVDEIFEDAKNKKRVENSSDTWQEDNDEVKFSMGSEQQGKAEKLYWSFVFDDGVIAKANAASPKDAPTEDGGKTSRNGNIWIGTAKNYKDSTWEKIQYSDDPPLKIIRGNLIGLNGIINAIAEYYLWLYYPLCWENFTSYRNFKRNKKEKFISISEVSLDAPVESTVADDDDNHQRSYGETIASPSLQYQGENSEDVIKDMVDILSKFTNFELALLLARAADLQTNKEIETFLKAGHSKISTYWNNILRKKALAIKDLLAQKTTLFLIFKRIEAEEGGKLFLSKIRKAFEKKNLGGLL